MYALSVQTLNRCRFRLLGPPIIIIAFTVLLYIHVLQDSQSSSDIFSECAIEFKKVYFIEFFFWMPILWNFIDLD